MTKKVFIDPQDMDASLIKGIAKVILGGGIVALPTETVYGLAACVDNEAAVEKLYEIKDRSKEKPFTYVEDDSQEVVDNYFSTLTPFGYRLIDNFWPGPLTIVYYSNKNTKIGVRVPAHPVAREVIKAIKKELYLPSANKSGQKEALTAQEVESVFDGKLNLIVTSEQSLSFGRASTVVDLTYRPFKILREGIITEKEVVNVFIKKRILFVCTGNTCRSPMAEYIFKKYLEESKPYLKDRFEAISRGTLPLDGARVSAPAMNILHEKENIDAAGFRSNKLDKRILLSSDLIFAMEEAQRNRVLQLEPTVEGRLFTLKQFLPAQKEYDIPDPIGKPYAIYLEAYNLIKTAMLELMDWL